ncbi:MAG TPA: cation transporter [Dehalococcoidia bacterium]|nr:cation transporter [Dehalococcoidia bacterium]
MIEKKNRTNSTDNHHEAFTDYRRLKVTLAIVLGVMVAEIIGGVFSGSLALLGDAGHMLVDALALGLSLLAMTLARRPATATKTFGYHRFEILAALANGTILILVSIYIFYEAYQRFLEPPAIRTPLMLIVATIGLLANLGGLILLNKASHRSLNVKAAFWHIMGDTISSVGVIVAGVVILFTGWFIADAIAAVVIGVIILWGAARIVSESADVLLEAVPRHMAVGTVIDTIRNVPGVNEVHDIHIWTITSGIYALSAHLVIDDQMVSGSVEIVRTVRHELAQRYNISHTTLQLECESCPTGLVCEIDQHDSSGGKTA